MHHPPKVWDGVLRRLRTRMPPLVMEAWILPLQAHLEAGSDAEPDEGPRRLRLVAPGAFHEARVRHRHLEDIQAALRDLGEADLEVVLTQSDAGEPRDPGVAEPTRRAALPAPGSPALPAPTAASGPQRFDTFVAGVENALAREACLALAQGRQLALSPLVLVGPTGCGKSHLARAVATEARRSGLKGVTLVSAEQFTSAFTGALRRKEMTRFKQRFRDECQLLIVEDISFLQGKGATQDELLHTLEHLIARGRRVMLTADRLPREMSHASERLISQMSGGLVAEMEPAGPELRRRILTTKASNGGVRLPDECLDRLVERVPGNVRDLEGVLVQLVASAALLHRPIDLELTEAALRKVSPAQMPLLTVPAVVERVSSFFGLTPAELASRTRRRAVLVPRQITIYLCRRYTHATLTEIGRALGRDLPAVKNAIAVVERAILERAPLRYQVEALVERLGIQHPLEPAEPAPATGRTVTAADEDALPLRRTPLKTRRLEGRSQRERA